MSEANIINGLSIGLISLINVGGVFRIVYCIIMMNNQDIEQQMKKRIKHILIFLAIANSMFGLISYLRGYYGG